MRNLPRTGVLLFLAAAFCAPLFSQSQRDPLNEQETDQIREYADRPVERVKLYMKYVEQRTSAIDEMVGDTKIQNKPAKLRSLMEEFTRLVDELQDNLDSYDETHSDVRKALKDLVPASVRWQEVLNKPPADQTYDFSRKTAMDAAQSLSDQAHKLLVEQDKWFAEHKHDKDKDSGDQQKAPRE